MRGMLSAVDIREGAKALRNLSGSKVVAVCGCEKTRLGVESNREGLEPSVVLSETSRVSTNFGGCLGILAAVGFDKILMGLAA